MGRRNDCKYLDQSDRISLRIFAQNNITKLYTTISMYNYLNYQGYCKYVTITLYLETHHVI